MDTDWGRDYTAALGIVSISQQAYTRTGSNLTLNPPLTPAVTAVTIPFYNVYFSDTWHMKPSLTLTYGLGWTLEMPPVEKEGLQVELVDEANQLVDTQAYMHSREQAALTRPSLQSDRRIQLVNNTENRTESTRTIHTTAHSAHELPSRGIRASRRILSFGADTGESMAG